MSERCTGVILSADIDGRGFGFIKSPASKKICSITFAILQGVA
jgi:hypothetical protein